MLKRKFVEIEDNRGPAKNSLDSDEEDDANDDNYNVMNEDEFEGT